MTRGLRRIMVLVSVVCGASLALAPPVAAHSDDGTITAAGGDRVTGTSVRVEATITFNSDGHAAPSATATVVAERPGSTPVGPVPLKRDAATGVYAATIQLTSPGTWTLRYTSLSPTAVLERNITVDAVILTTPAPASTTSVPSTASTTVLTSEGTAPALSVAPSIVASQPGAVRNDRGGRGATTALFVGITAVIALTGGLIARRARRRADRT